MRFVEDQVREILSKFPSECAYLDYKIITYAKSKEHEFIRDIIAMLNSEEAIKKDKFIIIGVDEKERFLRGIDLDSWRDDNEWQNLIDKISPRPHVQSGVAKYEGRDFGYFYISKDNTDWVYEVKSTVIGDRTARVSEKNGVFAGQAFTRVGSRNDILYSDVREKLRIKKEQILTLEQIQSVKEPEIKILNFIFAFIIGSWDENYIGDTKVIGEITGSSYADFKYDIRKLSLKKKNLFIMDGKVWKCKNHKAQLLSISEQIYDSDIEVFFNCAEKIFKDIDPKFKLPPEQRIIEKMISEEKKYYSYSILKGVAQTIAILGNHAKEFRNCSRDKIVNCTYQFVRNLFQNIKDWKIYATIADVLEELGEACPDVFLQELEYLLETKDKAFIQFLSQQDDSVVSIRYGYQLNWVLGCLALEEKYFSRVMNVLLHLAEIQENFLETLVGIVLPWYPLTHASQEIRIGVFKGLALENESLTWKALMKLMPGKTVVGNQVPTPKYLVTASLPEKVNEEDYLESTKQYVFLACKLINRREERMADMINVLDVVSVETQTYILQSLYDNAEILKDREKEDLWNVIQDLLVKHKKYRDAEWALPEKSWRAVDEFARWLVPDSTAFVAVRLFKKAQYSLIEEKGNFLREEKKLRARQEKVIKDIYNYGNISALIEFSKRVENKSLVGAIMSPIITDEEMRELIQNSNKLEENDLVLGLVVNAPFDRLISSIATCKDIKRAEVLAKLLLTDECIEQVKALENEAEKLYWTTIDVWGIQLKNLENIIEAIEKLNYYRRPEKSIDICYNMIWNKRENIPLELIWESLVLNVEIHSTLLSDRYHTQELIKWLQNRDVPLNKMEEIEWRYLAILSEADGCTPKFLWKKLSSDPDYFVEILKIVYGKTDWKNVTKEVRTQMVEQSFRLLFGWKVIPGLNEDNTVDKISLEEWISEVKEATRENNLTGTAMNYLGKTMFYAPVAPDGFFIDRSVAQILQNDIDEGMRLGYYTEAFNSCGGYFVDPTGSKEFKMENSYLEKAWKADAEGYFRFAETLRKIAAVYHKEGEHNIAESRGKDI